MSDTPATKDGRPAPTPAPKDGCPAWASLLIDQIAALEIRLGNIRPSTDWKDVNLQDLYERLGDGAGSFDEQVVDDVFKRIARDLTHEGRSPAEIAAFVNVRIPSGKLPYCNAEEVVEAARAE